MKEKIGEELKVSFLMILGRDGIRNFSKFWRNFFSIFLNFFSRKWNSVLIFFGFIDVNFYSFRIELTLFCNQRIWKVIFVRANKFEFYIKEILEFFIWKFGVR
jgi:hypothetical protein